MPVLRFCPNQGGSGPFPLGPVLVLLLEIQGKDRGQEHHIDY